MCECYCKTHDCCDVCKPRLADDEIVRRFIEAFDEYIELKKQCLGKERVEAFWRMIGYRKRIEAVLRD